MNFSTTTMLAMLEIEKEENSLVSREMLDSAIAWLDTFQAYPLIEFQLEGEPPEGRLLHYLENNKQIIEKTVAAYMKKSQRKYGRTPKPQEQVRSEHIGVYLTSAEMAELAILAGTHSPLQKRGGDTSSRRKIAAYLRAAGLRESPPIVPEISIEVWSELSHAFKNLDQIAKKRIEGEELVDADSQAIKAIRDILITLHPQVDC